MVYQRTLAISSWRTLSSCSWAVVCVCVCTCHTLCRLEGNTCTDDAYQSSRRCTLVPSPGLRRQGWWSPRHEGEQRVETPPQPKLGSAKSSHTELCAWSIFGCEGRGREWNYSSFTSSFVPPGPFVYINIRGGAWGQDKWTSYGYGQALNYVV